MNEMTTTTYSEKGTGGYADLALPSFPNMARRRRELSMLKSRLPPAPFHI